MKPIFGLSPADSPSFMLVASNQTKTKSIHNKFLQLIKNRSNAGRWNRLCMGWRTNDELHTQLRSLNQSYIREKKSFPIFGHLIFLTRVFLYYRLITVLACFRMNEVNACSMHSIQTQATFNKLFLSLKRTFKCYSHSRHAQTAYIPVPL